MNPAIRPHRPWRVTFVAMGVFLFAAAQAAGAWQAWSQRALLASLSLPAPIFWIVSGVVWAAAGTAAAWGLWRMRRWAACLTAAGAPLYSAFWAVQRRVWAGSHESLLGLPFAIGVHAVGVILVLAIILAPGTFRRFTRS